MANYQLLKADIDAKVYQNGAQEITGANLNSVLNAMVTTLGAEYQFAGVATIDTNPGTPDAKVFYIANGKGTYTNFGGINVTEDEVVVLYWDTAWHKEATGIASNEKLSELERLEGLLNLQSIINSGNLLTKGTIYSDGEIDFIKDTSIHFYMPIAPINSIAVPDGYIIKSVAYFNMWEAADNYELNKIDIVNNQFYKFTNIAPKVFFNISKPDNSAITPDELYEALGNYEKTEYVLNLAGFVKEQKDLDERKYGETFLNTNFLKLSKITKDKEGIYVDYKRDSLYIYNNHLYAYDGAKLRELAQLSEVKHFGNYNSTLKKNDIYFDADSNAFRIVNNQFYSELYSTLTYNGQIAHLLNDKYFIDQNVDDLKVVNFNDLKYENHAVSGGEIDPEIRYDRLASPLLVSYGMRIKVNDGYLMYIYFYNEKGEFLAQNETGLIEFEYKFPFKSYVRFVFLKKNKTDRITSIDGVINEYSGLYDEDIEQVHDDLLFTDLSPWEPLSADSGYSNPTNGWGRDTKRDDWTAANKYKYYDFLAHYYDSYLGESDNGKYRVSKRGLWQDTANLGYEVFEYDFCPLNYKYTIMLSAGMNADETQGIWGLATFIRALMGKEESNLAIMKDNIRFKVIPILNASGFDQNLLRYNYVNGVNPNFNFNYIDSWARHDVPTSEKGDYPDSNYETKMLKQWINENSGKAVLWLDLHTGRWNEPLNKIILDIRFSSESAYFNDFNRIHLPLVKKFYLDKGYVTSSDDIGGAISVRDNLDYQKHRYALDICGINSAMPEMHLESTGYGADGYTNNTTEGIKCYVLQIRQIIMYVINKSISENNFIELGKIEETRRHARFK